MADDKKKSADPAAGEEGSQARRKPLPRVARARASLKAAKVEAAPQSAPIKRTEPPRLKQLFNKEVLPRLMKEFNYTNKRTKYRASSRSP